MNNLQIWAISDFERENRGVENLFLKVVIQNSLYFYEFSATIFQRLSGLNVAVSTFLADFYYAPAYRGHRFVRQVTQTLTQPKEMIRTLENTILGKGFFLCMK